MKWYQTLNRFPVDSKMIWIHIPPTEREGKQTWSVISQSHEIRNSHKSYWKVIPIEDSKIIQSIFGFECRAAQMVTRILYLGSFD